MEYTNTMTFSQFRRFFSHNCLLFICWTLIFGILGFAISKYALVPKYTSTVTFVVNQKGKNNDIDINKQQADIQIINTYKDLLTNEKLTKLVAKKANQQYLNSNFTAKKIKNAIRVTSEQNSQAFSLKVSLSNPSESQYVAQILANKFQKEVKVNLNVNNITIYSGATLPQEQSFPKVKLFTVFFAGAGFILSLLYKLLSHFVDQRVWNVEFLNKISDKQCIGIIKHIKSR